MRKTFYINSISGGAQLIITTVLIFFTLPVFINKLGIELYGVFSLILLIGNLNTFINLGLNTALIKFLAEQGKCVESDHDILVAYLILLVLLIPLTLICIYFSNPILISILKIPQKYFNSDTVILYTLLLISNVLLFVGQISSAILDAQQKIYITNILQTIYNFLYWGLLLASLYLYNSFRMIGWSILIASIVWFIAITIISISSWGKIQFIGFRNTAKFHIKKQLSYSLKLYLSGVIGFFYEPFSKILLSQFVSVSSVGYLDIALRIRSQIWNLITRLLYPIFPFIAQLSDHEKLKSFINDIEQKIAFLLLHLLCTVIFCTKPFIDLWLKRDVEIIYTSVVYITTFYLCALVVVPVYQYFQAKGYPGKTVLMQTLNVLVNGIVFFIFYKSMGYYAMVFGNVMAIFSSLILCVYYQKKYLDSLIFSNILQIIKYLSILACLILSGLFVGKFLPSNLTKLLFFPIFFLSFAILLFRIFKIFSEYDIRKYIGDNYLRKVISNILIINT
jgi:O-antigen/teichoic acid export membrane protein